MGTALTVLNNTQLTEGGQGIDFNSPLFRIKPATITVVQKNTLIEGAIPGKLRIGATGDQYDEMFCTLLVMPNESRSWHIGNQNELNRTPENLMCFSRDMIKPDVTAKMPQAITCATCAKSDWKPWQEHKKATGFADKNLIPPCDPSWYAVMLDTVFQLPLRMFIRSKSREPFEQGMQNLARTLAISKAQGKKPNIFDVKFRLGTKIITTGKFQSYVPTFTDFKYISDEEREKFGEIYLAYTNKDQGNQQSATTAELEAANQAIDSAVLNSEYVTEESTGDIII
jgi:hypothetical protein